MDAQESRGSARVYCLVLAEEFEDNLQPNPTDFLLVLPHIEYFDSRGDLSPCNSFSKCRKYYATGEPSLDKSLSLWWLQKSKY